MMLISSRYDFRFSALVHTYVEERRDARCDYGSSS